MPVCGSFSETDLEMEKFIDTDIQKRDPDNGKHLKASQKSLPAAF